MRGRTSRKDFEVRAAEVFIKVGRSEREEADLEKYSWRYTYESDVRLTFFFYFYIYISSVTVLQNLILNLVWLISIITSWLYLNPHPELLIDHCLVYEYISNRRFYKLYFWVLERYFLLHISKMDFASVAVMRTVYTGILFGSKLSRCRSFNIRRYEWGLGSSFSEKFSWIESISYGNCLTKL